MPERRKSGNSELYLIKTQNQRIGDIAVESAFTFRIEKEKRKLGEIERKCEGDIQ